MTKKLVPVRYIFDIEVEVPEDWTMDDVSFSRSEGSWCAKNALQEITKHVERNGWSCPCRCFKFAKGIL